LPNKVALTKKANLNIGSIGGINERNFIKLNEVKLNEYNNISNYLLSTKAKNTQKKKFNLSEDANFKHNVRMKDPPGTTKSLEKKNDFSKSSFKLK